MAKALLGNFYYALGGSEGVSRMFIRYWIVIRELLGLFVCY